MGTIHHLLSKVRVVYRLQEPRVPFPCFLTEKSNDDLRVNSLIIILGAVLSPSWLCFLKTSSQLV
jgi:hypothetical protein